MSPLRRGTTGGSFRTTGKEPKLTGREIKLKRLFNNGENAVVVALDHGMFDGPLPGMIDLPEVVRRIDPAVDAVLLAPGMVAHCGHAFAYKGAPMSIVRLNWSSHFCFHWDYQEGIASVAADPGDAIAAGADIALVCLTLHTGSEERDTSNVGTFCKLANKAHRLGMPVVGEYFPARPDRLSPEELHDDVFMGCRIISELGADLIKTFYTHRFAEVTGSCPVPILGLGAEKTPKQIQALELAERIVQNGGRGVVFGRNAVQVADPTAFQQALCDVVKRDVPPTEAVRVHGLVD
jgi:DhnA family fructose-bisphosphate aldolase class Ia